MVHRPRTAAERWAFAFSAKAQWRAKVQSDIGKIAETGRAYARAYFISSRFIKDKTRAEVEDLLRKKHGFDVRILDRNWILDRVFTGRHEQLAIDELGIPVAKQPEVKKGPIDAEREEELAALETAITKATQNGRFTFQLVDDCIRAAKIARNRELPRTDVEGRLLRARRVAGEHGTSHQQLLVAYEYAATAYWYFEDYDTFVELYPQVEALAKDTLNAYDLELLANLWLLLHAAVRQQWLDPKKADLKPRTTFITGQLERLTNDTARPSSALQARTLLLHQRLVRTLPSNVDPILDELCDVMQRAKIASVAEQQRMGGRMLVEPNPYLLHQTQFDVVPKQVFVVQSTSLTHTVLPVIKGILEPSQVHHLQRQAGRYRAA